MSQSQLSTDVAIIGGGPAGSAAGAFLVQRGHRVLCLEKGFFPRYVIGESLLPRCNELLEEAGLLDAVRSRNYLVKHGALFLSGDRSERFCFAESLDGDYAHSFQVPRGDFDRCLATEARRKGLDLRFGHRVDAVQTRSDGVKLHVTDIENQEELLVEAAFVMDCSGYGRVLARLLDLEEPALLPQRISCFTQIEGDIRPPADHEGDIWICTHPQNGWLWIIPFNNGRTSVGMVCDRDYWNSLHGPNKKRLFDYLQSEPNAARRLAQATQVAPVRLIDGYSRKVKTFHGERWVLAGNASDFLDPVFSSGVTLALESSLLAARLVERSLAGDKVDWDNEYDHVLNEAVQVFLRFIESWYDGVLPEIFLAKKRPEHTKNRITSILAGYVLRQDNPFVRRPAERLAALHSVCQPQ